ncbi:Colicin V production protein [Staphylococcus lugdunensis HKU09-01]|uniref:CvpA family protein n=1 Tax=Staphylococcus lugdunensis TaxID=28035 RepID=UPI0001C54D1A|nr:CvpA family protein [Staphylococcus lugdunensis]ADC87830.1 Colicin V production protein [Staphylococcus lugdunensis HKU09-01]
MILDLIVLLFVGYVMLMGYRRGWWLNCLHVMTTMVALWIAHNNYQGIAQRLLVFLPFPKTVAYDMTYAVPFSQVQQRFDAIVAFALVAILSKIILYLLVVSFDNIVTYKKLYNWSRWLGALFGLLSALISVQILLYMLALYPNEWVQMSLAHSWLSKAILLHTTIVSAYILNL